MTHSLNQKIHDTLFCQDKFKADESDKALINEKDNEYGYPIVYAILSKHKAAVEFCLKNNVDLDTPEYQGNSAAEMLIELGGEFFDLYNKYYVTKQQQRNRADVSIEIQKLEKEKEQLLKPIASNRRSVLQPNIRHQLAAIIVKQAGLQQKIAPIKLPVNKPASTGTDVISTPPAAKFNVITDQTSRKNKTSKSTEKTYQTKVPSTVVPVTDDNDSLEENSDASYYYSSEGDGDDSADDSVQYDGSDVEFSNTDTSSLWSGSVDSVYYFTDQEDEGVDDAQWQHSIEVSYQQERDNTFEEDDNDRDEQHSLKNQTIGDGRQNDNSLAVVYTNELEGGDAVVAKRSGVRVQQRDTLQSTVVATPPEPEEAYQSEQLREQQDDDVSDVIHNNESVDSTDVATASEEAYQSEQLPEQRDANVSDVIHENESVDSTVIATTPEVSHELDQKIAKGEQQDEPVESVVVAPAPIAQHGLVQQTVTPVEDETPTLKFDVSKLTFPPEAASSTYVTMIDVPTLPGFSRSGGPVAAYLTSDMPASAVANNEQQTSSSGKKDKKLGKNSSGRKKALKKDSSKRDTKSKKDDSRKRPKGKKSDKKRASELIISSNITVKSGQFEIKGHDEFERVYKEAKHLMKPGRRKPRIGGWKCKDGKLKELRALLQTNPILRRAVDKRRHTLLHKAVKKFDWGAVKTAVLGGVDVNIESLDGNNTAYDMITSSALVLQIEKYTNNLIETEKVEIIKKIMKYLRDITYRPFYKAVENADFKAAEISIGTYRSAFSEVDDQGRNVLHVAAGLVNKAKHVEASSIVELIINEDKSLLNSTTNNNDTALHLACAVGNVQVALFLVLKQINLHAVNNNKDTALHCLTEHYANEENPSALLEKLIAELVSRGLRTDKDSYNRPKHISTPAQIVQTEKMRKLLKTKYTVKSPRVNKTNLLYSSYGELGLTPGRCELDDVQESITLLLEVEFFYQKLLSKPLDKGSKNYYDTLRGTTSILQFFIPNANTEGLKKGLVNQAMIKSSLESLADEINDINKERSKSTEFSEELLTRLKFFNAVLKVLSAITGGKYSVDDDYIKQSHQYFAHCIAKKFEGYCADGRIDLVEWMLDSDQFQFDITQWQANKVKNPLLVAVREGRGAVVSYLYDKYPALRQNDLLIIAVKWGRSDVVSFLAQKPDMSDHIIVNDVVKALADCTNFSPYVPFLLCERWPAWEVHLAPYMLKADDRGNYAIHLAIQAADITRLNKILKTQTGIGQLQKLDAAERSPSQLCSDLVMATTDQDRIGKIIAVMTWLKDKTTALTLVASTSDGLSHGSTVRPVIVADSSYHDNGQLLPPDPSTVDQQAKEFFSK